MTFLRVLARVALVTVLAVTGTSVATPGLAGQAEIDLLYSYVGSWRGRGIVVGAKTETVVCRMTLSPGNQGRLNYRGSCALAGQTVTVAGTIVYNEAAKRYEAVMSSNTSFKPAPAAGQRQGNGIVFQMRDRGQDEAGNDMTISADITLRPAEIKVEFNVVFNKTGDTIHASVPFTM